MGMHNTQAPDAMRALAPMPCYPLTLWPLYRPLPMPLPLFQLLLLPVPLPILLGSSCRAPLARSLLLLLLLLLLLPWLRPPVSLIIMCSELNLLVAAPPGMPRIASPGACAADGELQHKGSARTLEWLARSWDGTHTRKCMVLM